MILLTTLLREVMVKTFKKPLSKDEEAYYLAKSQEGDIAARNILVEYNLRLVAHIVKKYNSNGRSMEDLLSIGTIGLIKAINTFSGDKGNRLVTYASRCIENELLMRLRQERKEAREVSLYEPIGTDREGNDINLIDIIYSDDEEILDDFVTRDNVARLKAVFDKVLDEREQEIMMYRYSLFGNDELTQKELAERLGISRSYVSRIEKKALLKLRNALT
jgi:RNA polymerase sporulation-specific sigma factor